MLADQPPPDVTRDLYALVVYLHASCNRDLFDAIAAEQVPFSALQLLERLRGGRWRPTVRQAAAVMQVSRPGASRTVAELARRGLVMREVDERDYRAKRIEITPAGEEVIARLHAARLERVIAFTQTLTPEERAELERALAKVLEREDVAAYRPAA